MIDGAMVVRLRTVVTRFFYQASTDWTFLTRMIFKDALNTTKEDVVTFHGGSTAKLATFVMYRWTNWGRSWSRRTNWLRRRRRRLSWFVRCWWFIFFISYFQSTQEKNRVSSDMNELRDHLDIKDRKISVLQRKVFIFLDVTVFSIEFEILFAVQ